MKKYLLILVLVALVPTANAVIGQVWNSADDWHIAPMPQNAAAPTNDWLYGFKWEGQGDGLTTPLHLFSNVGGSGDPWYLYYADWDGMMPSSSGYVHQNMSGDAHDIFGAHWEPWQTTLWGGANDGTLPTFRWVAPEDGEYSVDVLFTGNTNGGQYSYYNRSFVVTTVGGVGTVVDTGVMYDSYYTSGDVPGATNVYSNASIFLTAGDTIDFMVDDGDSGTPGCIGLDATIVQIPEPATMMLLGLGGLALARRRK